MLRTVVIVPLALVACTLAVKPAAAFPQFFKVFKAEYVEDNTNEEFVELVNKEAKCLVCHQGKKRKNQNVYGMQLSKLIGKDDKKDVDKITEALKKVAEMHTDAEDDESPTYGDLIAKGKLPGGELEDLEQEPADEEEEE